MYHVIYLNDDVTDGYFGLAPEATRPYEQNAVKIVNFVKLASLNAIDLYYDRFENLDFSPESLNNIRKSDKEPTKGF